MTMEATQVRDTAWLMADHVATTPFEALSPDAVGTAKRSILDTLGVCIGGIGMMPSMGELVDLLGDERPAESTILGTGRRVPARTAAFVNGTAAHVLDYDDMHEIMGAHPSGPIIPAALALAERIGNVDGK